MILRNESCRCDLAAKRQIDPARERADVERVLGPIDLLWQARDSVEERRARASPRRTRPPRRHATLTVLVLVRAAASGMATSVSRSLVDLFQMMPQMRQVVFDQKG